MPATPIFPTVPYELAPAAWSLGCGVFAWGLLLVAVHWGRRQELRRLRRLLEEVER